MVVLQTKGGQKSLRNIVLWDASYESVRENRHPYLINEEIVYDNTAEK